MTEGPIVAEDGVEVLLLEDDPLDVELIANRLERANLRFAYTHVSGREAFESAIHARTYGLILADFALPDFDGLRALEIASAVQPHVPFIFISGRVGEEVAIDTLQRGATDYVLKHRMERLVPAVLRALNEAREHAARMQVEALFRQSESRFQHVIDSVPQMIWLANSAGDLRYTNRSWQAYIGEQATSCCSRDFVASPDYEEFERRWSDARGHHRPFTTEARLSRRADGELRWHLIRVAPMATAPGDPAPAEDLWVGSATDMQEQKLHEEALRTAEKLAVTGRMAASIAHEINNPLESLTNLVFLIKTESEGNELSMRYLDMAESELSRVSAITKQTLQFYRDPTVPEAIEARTLASEVLTLFTARLGGKALRTEVDISPDLVFEGIKGEIRQVLINLVGNAIDAAPDGGLVTLHGFPTDLNGLAAAEIQISDNGSGFDPEQARKLFQPFYSTKGSHGTGLGLWVSRGIVGKHGGELRLDIEPTGDGNRTTATLRLPLRASLKQPFPEPEHAS